MIARIMTTDAGTDRPLRSNVPELTVSELAFSLKKTLEDTYGRVRIRGELSRVKIHTSGHMYSDLKDENALINAVCWKTTLSKLSVKPEEGLEVICTGRISTYPARSNYQLIIEAMELAGEGALLKMLEERKKRLAAEGLFAPERKKPLPFLPARIGVVTSATGAVIRDILHRLDDRFPRHVLLWPVPVQGAGAAEKIAAAIDGFSKMEGPNRPDLVIVARGGGSLEDLMAFNEEVVVRAAANCTIPLISAVGHETDTTLIDYAADLRAPTPTAAAEMAVPERLSLLAQVQDDGQRLTASAARTLTRLRDRTAHLGARLGDPGRLLEIKTQKLDHLSHKLTGCFERGLGRRKERLLEQGARLTHPKALIAHKRRELTYSADTLSALAPRLLKEREKHLLHAGRLLESMSFKSVLNRGFVVVRDEHGKPITAAGQAQEGQKVRLEFKNDEKREAIIGKKA